jgi:hypothetical protein
MAPPGFFKDPDVLNWLAIALCAAALIIVVRWWPARIDALGRKRPFPSISVVCLVALALAALAPGVLRARLEHRLGVASEAIVGMPVEVNCQSFGGAFVDGGGDLGYVAFGPGGVPERATLIKRDQCRDLSAYLRSNKVDPPREQIVAVHVLTHEAIHMSGVTSEAKTECLAVQHDARMAQLLGAPPEAAATLALSYWTDVYPHMSTEYRSDECGPGLPLDARLSGAPWSPVE